MAEATLYMWTARGMFPAPDQSFKFCWRKNTDYTALERKCQEMERERDEYKSVADSMGRDAVEFSAKLADAQAELARLRAVEAEVTQIKHDLALSNILHHAAELKIREEHGHHMRTIEGVRNVLAEACGRKG